MPRLILLLLLFALPGLGWAEPASYRWQVLISTDQKPETGCAVSFDGRTEQGIDARVIALSDRSQVSSVVVEFCENAQWQQGEVQEPGAMLRFDIAGSGGDLVEWSVARAHFERYPQLSMRISAERLDRPAQDRLGPNNQFNVLSLELGAAPEPVPLDGGALVLAGCILLAGVTGLRRGLPRSLIAGLLLPVLLIGPGSATIAGINEVAPTQVAAHDPLNDSVGQDAGVDIAHARISADPEQLRFAVEVNNIQADALPEQARVLFVGNSLTYYNELPLMLKAIAAQAGIEVDIRAVTIGGASLQDHYRDRTALAEIARGHYQLVILQQGPSSLAEGQEHLLEWSQRFSSAIRASGARPALYMVWPERERFAYFGAVHMSYRNAALAVGGMFIPAGDTWLHVWQSDPGLALYGPDQFHPSVLGSYAAALSMFCELFRQSPVGLPDRLQWDNGQSLQFAPDQARLLQQSAWQTHLQHGIAGH